MERQYNGLFTLLVLSILFLFTSCKTDVESKKFPDYSENIVDVSNEVKEIKTDLLLGQSKLKIIGDYLLICDIFSLDSGFHFYDKKDFKYLGSGGRKGQGPGEIIKYKNINIIANENDEKIFYVFDYSQVLLYRFNIDSLLANKLYVPARVIGFKVTNILNDFTVLSDSVLLGLGSYTTSNSSFIDGVVKLNIKTKKTQEFGYVNPKIKEFGGNNTHSSFAGSISKNRYVRAYLNQDLMTICDIEGDLVSDIYGPKWKGKKVRELENSYFKKVELYYNYVIVEYNGSKRWILDENKRPRGVYAQKFLVFDLNGNYMKTLDVGEEVRYFCLDEETNRLFLSFRNRDVLAYIDLNGILN